MTTAERVDASELEQFTTDVLAAVGTRSDVAAAMARAIVAADRRGVDSHGVVRLEAYVTKLEAGGINGDPDITVEHTAPAALCVDADHGPGQIAAARAMDAAIEVAADTGVSCATVSASNHFGLAGYYAERASAAGYIGLVTTNADATVASYGGMEPSFGTNPIAVSVPTSRPFPITVDLATSAASLGAVELAAAAGADIPSAWGLDDRGEPTTDPDAVTALRPLGGPKGFGLALVVDVLSGVLSGAGLSATRVGLYDDADTSMGIGHAVAAIDVTAFRERDAFLADIDELIETITAMPPRPGFDEVRLPGQGAARTRRDRDEHGVPLDPDVLAGLDELANKYGLDPVDRMQNV